MEMENEGKYMDEKDEMMKELYDIAEKVSSNAYTPFSHFNVGAALLAEDGRVYTGVNVENSSFGATICAERTAFVKAISEGERKFKAIAVATSPQSHEEALPCGICRQFMYEFAPDIYVITGKSKEKLNTRKLSELLPDGFKLER